MHIALSGKLGSGKSTVCRYLKDKYNFKVYSVGSIQRELAASMNMSILELNKKQQTDKTFDNLIDKKLIEVSNSNRDKNIIFDSRIAFHLLNDIFKVYLTINPDVAAERVMSDNSRGNVESYRSIEEAKASLLERENEEIIKFKNLYSVDISDLSNYHLVLDTSFMTPESAVEIIYKDAKEYRLNG